MSKPKTAAVRRDVTDLQLRHAWASLDLLRMMREQMVGELRDLPVTGRVYFAVSKVAPRCISVTAIAGEDDAYSLTLIQRMRQTRKRLNGYRTEWDSVSDG